MEKKILKHYALSIKSHNSEEDYEDGIMAESLEDAIKKFKECLDFQMTDEEWTNCIIQI